MTQPLPVLVALLALVVAAVTVWFFLPRPPALDTERWFKVMLATLLRGEVEAAGGSVDQWEELVVRHVPFHPAGRLPEQKVTRPQAFDFPGAALPGEVALLEALARAPTLPQRWAVMYDADPAGLEARLCDPFELGADYDPGRLLGPGGAWEDLAAWGGGGGEFRDALTRRSVGGWVLVRGQDRGEPDLLGALAGLLGERARTVEWEQGDPEAGGQRVQSAMVEAAPEVADRIVVVGEAEGVHLILRGLVLDAGLRDRVRAVVSVGGVLGGRTDEDGPWGEASIRDWMAAWFRHRELDTEAQRSTPYLALQWLDRSADPPGVPGLPLGSARFPEPADEGGLDAYVDPLDLGPVPTDVPLEQAARALWAVTECVVASRRG